MTLMLLPVVGQADWTTNFLYCTASNGMNYRLFVPLDYTPSGKYPLVLYLHFAGHEGTDNQTHMDEAVVAKTNWMTLPTFIVCPQSDYDYPSHGWPCGFAYEPEVIRARECVAEVQGGFSVDSRRLYVSGVSAGGGGSWRITSIYSNTFAAVAPVVGMADVWEEGQVSSWAPRLIDTPVWAFSGGNDTDRKTATGYMFDEISNAVVAAGHTFDTNFHRHTVFPGIGHLGVVHDMAIAAGLTPWMFGQELWSMYTPAITGADMKGTNCVISWGTSQGKHYRVQITTNLLDNPPLWSNVWEVVGDGTLKTYTNTPPSASPAFYRVVLDIPQ
ncbi:MAG: hypothetical protein PHR35_07335 [Kiritimatiellae bacterium]|nr:hypothetical protein [Kiritimatiellia bacterium]